MGTSARFKIRAPYGNNWPEWVERAGDGWNVYEQDGVTLRGGSPFAEIEYCEGIRGEPWRARWAGNSFHIENYAHGDPKIVDSFTFRDWDNSSWLVSWNIKANQFDLNPWQPVAIDVDKLNTSSLTVYRQDKSAVTVSTNGNITFNVDAGVLLILNDTKLVCAFSPDQWLTVNIAPV